MNRGRTCVLAVLAALSGVTASYAAAGKRDAHARLAPGAVYVAMGSSFAAGPGVTHPADTPTTRCARSNDNYAHQLARSRGLHLIDVSCSSAKTVHLLEPWAELPAQLDALTPDTALITATVGGNDVGYIGGLMAASCRATGKESCPLIPPATERTWSQLDGNLRTLVAEMRRRAPKARIILIDYPTVLPDKGECAATPLPPGQADESRAVARRFAALMARVARETRVELLRASALTHGHDACAPEPWMNGAVRPAGEGSFVPYHPNLAGMRAIAQALDRMVG